MQSVGGKLKKEKILKSNFFFLVCKKVAVGRSGEKRKDIVSSLIIHSWPQPLAELQSVGKSTIKWIFLFFST